MSESEIAFSPERKFKKSASWSDNHKALVAVGMLIVYPIYEASRRLLRRAQGKPIFPNSAKTGV